VAACAGLIYNRGPFDEMSPMSEQSQPRLLKTKDVLEATGITHQMLYRYVTLGLIEEASNTPGGQRLFHPRVVPLIHRIRGLVDTGYALRHIREIFFKEERVRRACGVEGPAEPSDRATDAAADGRGELSSPLKKGSEREGETSRPGSRR